jgi:fibronectin-binding autotransporter adhesin
MTGEYFMQRIEMKGKRWRGRGTKPTRCRRLRPTVMALEGRVLLSTFTVDSTADDGSAGTLRWAIGQANADKQADTIVFSSLFNTPQTITLTTGQLKLTDPATTMINGPGANLLTVNGGGASRVFAVYGGSAALSGLTITGGNAGKDVGGGLVNVRGTLTLTNCTVRQGEKIN